MIKVFLMEQNSWLTGKTPAITPNTNTQNPDTHYAENSLLNPNNNHPIVVRAQAILTTVRKTPKPALLSMEIFLIL